MKKILFAIVAMMALVFTSCKKETATVRVVNDYSETAVVIFSTDKDCTSTSEAEFFAVAEPHKAYSKEGVKLNGLYAIIMVGTGAKYPDGSEVLQKVGVSSLNDEVGMATVTVRITPDGMYAIAAEGL